MILHFTKYGAISAIALILDLTLYRFFIELNRYSIPVAATLSYCSGLLFSYIVFTLLLFKNTKYSNRRFLEMLLFLSSGLLGSATTFAVSTLTTRVMGIGNWGAKFSAVGISFVIVYAYRTNFVFPRLES